MGFMNWLVPLASWIAGFLLAAGVPGDLWALDRSRDIPILSKGGGGLSFDRAALDGRIRQELHLGPGSRIAIGGLPRRFQGPSGEELSAELTEEGPQTGGVYLFLLNVLGNGVARESFYLHVKVSGESAKVPDYPLLREKALRSGGSSGDSLVHSGDTVRVTVSGRGFMIRFSGIAQGEGFAGDQIPVINPVSGRSLTGLITGHDQVMIRLSGSPS
jgi:hypothetical protein